MKLAFNPLTGQFDLVQDLSGYVPYTGATGNVNLGANSITASTAHNTPSVFGATTFTTVADAKLWSISSDSDGSHGTLGVLALGEYTNATTDTTKSQFGINAYARIVGNGGCSHSLYGVLGGRYGAFNLGSGTVVRAGGINLFPINNSSTGTVTNAYGVYIENSVNSGGGSIGTAYSIYDAGQTVAGTNWGLYGLSAKNYLSGSLAVGSLIATPDAITAANTGTAASIATTTTEVTTDGDSDEDNVTLANGTVGQIKHIYCKTAGNAADSLKVTPATMLYGTNVRFGENPVGKGVTLVYTASGWVVVGHTGTITNTQQGTMHTLGSGSAIPNPLDTTDILAVSKSNADTNVHRGMLVKAEYSGTATGGSQLGLNAFAQNLSTGTTALCVGGRYGGRNFLGGTITKMNAVDTLCQNLSTGTMVTVNGFYATSPSNGGGGTLNNWNGLYVEASTTGSTSNRGINLAGDSSLASAVYQGSAIVFGAAQDSAIAYDGTDLVVNPQIVGTGDVKLLAGSVNTFTGYKVQGTAGLGTVATPLVITTAKLTAGGTQGSQTFIGGILTAQTAAT